MGTTRVKVFDLATEDQGEKTSKKKGAPKVEVKKDKNEIVEETKLEEKQKIEESKKEISTETAEEKPQKEKATVGPLRSEASKPHPEGQITKSTKPTESKKEKHTRGKKYQEARELIDPEKAYPAREALELLYKTATASFDPTVEIHLNVTDKSVRGTVNLPHALQAKKGKKMLVFTDKPAQTDDKNIILADETKIGDIENGSLKPGRDFDMVFANPKFMPALAKVAKVLGPRGMMPNPKNGTITDDITKIASLSDATGLEYRTDPTVPVIHTKLGKLSLKKEALQENLVMLTKTIGLAKIRKATISSTMSPGIKLDLATIL